MPWTLSTPRGRSGASQERVEDAAADSFGTTVALADEDVLPTRFVAVRATGNNAATIPLGKSAGRAEVTGEEETSGGKGTHSCFE